jgi:hypothetical protein
MMAEAGASGARSATPAPDPPASTNAAEDAMTNAKGLLRLNLPLPVVSEGAPTAPEPAFITFLE